MIQYRVLLNYKGGGYDSQYTSSLKTALLLAKSACLNKNVNKVRIIRMERGVHDIMVDILCPQFSECQPCKKAAEQFSKKVFPLEPSCPVGQKYDKTERRCKVA